MSFLELVKLLALIACFTTLEANIRVRKYDIALRRIVWTDAQVGKLAFITAGDHSIYRSSDDFNFTMMPALKNINTVLQNNLNHQIYFEGENSYWSDDGGINLTFCRLPGRMLRYEVHPTKDWMLAQRGTSLYVSKDFGRNWVLVSNLLPQYGNKVFTWGNAGLDFVTPSRIHFVTTALTLNSSIDPMKDVFVYTDDFGTTLIPVMENSIGVIWLADYIILGVRAQSSGGGGLQSWVSHKRDRNGNTPIPIDRDSFFETQWPFEGETNYAFNVLDGGSGTIWTAVNHGGRMSHIGYLYNSDNDGVRNSLVHPHISRYYSSYDLSPLPGLEGIYLVNHVTNSDDIADTDPKSVDEIQTQITFDNGGEWKFLTPPKVDINGEPFVCAIGECHLHLHGMTSWGFNNFAPFYSMPNAIGLIMATGSVGKYLENNEDFVGTFLSRDAGFTWTQVHADSTIYEYGDHGGILIFVPNNKATDTVRYSLDEGKTFKDFKFAEELVDVSNIRVEPLTANTKFVIHGTTKVGKTGVVYILDMYSLFPRECSPADYEDWSPNDGDKCVLGRTVTYSRKKQTALCVNPSTKTNHGTPVSCNCTREDYECDFDYDPVEDSEECVWVGSGPDMTGKLPHNCVVGTKYSVTRGFRKVADNSCRGGAKTAYEPLFLTCTALPCVRADFTCDYGFKLAPDSLNCIWDTAYGDDRTGKLPAGCTPGKFYNVTKGYEKLETSTCEGGVSNLYGKVKTMCPKPDASEDGSSMTPIFIVIPLLLILIAAVFGMYFTGSPPIVYDTFQKLFAATRSSPFYSGLYDDEDDDGLALVDDLELIEEQNEEMGSDADEEKTTNGNGESKEQQPDVGVDVGVGVGHSDNNGDSEQQQPQQENGGGGDLLDNSEDILKF